MILKFLFSIKENENNILFNILNNKIMTIEEVVSNNLFLFWNSSFVIVELENSYILKSIKTGNKYRFNKREIIKNKSKYNKLEGNKYEG